MALPIPWCPRPANVAAADPPILQQVLQLMQQQQQQQSDTQSLEPSTENPLAGEPQRVHVTAAKSSSPSPAAAEAASKAAAVGAAPAAAVAEASTAAQTAAAAAAPTAAAAARFEGCLSDARIFFCGEHTSDFGQQCVHGAMHSGVRAAAECLASLFGVDFLPWTLSSWGEQQIAADASAAEKQRAGAAAGASPAAEAAEAGVSSGNKEAARPVSTASTAAAAAAATGKPDEWHSWWYSSDPSYCWGPSAKDTHSQHFDTALQRPVPREQRKQRLLQLLRCLQQQEQHRQEQQQQEL